MATVDVRHFGLVVRLPADPPTGLDCACSLDGGKCLAHWATAGQERPRVKATPWLPADA